MYAVFYYDFIGIPSHKKGGNDLPDLSLGGRQKCITNYTFPAIVRKTSVGRKFFQEVSNTSRTRGRRTYISDEESYKYITLEETRTRYSTGFLRRT